MNRKDRKDRLPVIADLAHGIQKFVKLLPLLHPHTVDKTIRNCERRKCVMTKYDMTAIRYLEPGFLPLARNRKAISVPTVDLVPVKMLPA